MQNKMYKVTILRQFRLSENAVFLGCHAGTIGISSNFSGPPRTQLPKASPGRTWDAAHQAYTLEDSKENERAPNTK